MTRPTARPSGRVLRVVENERAQRQAAKTRYADYMIAERAEARREILLAAVLFLALAAVIAIALFASNLEAKRSPTQSGTAAVAPCMNRFCPAAEFDAVKPKQRR